MAKKQAHDATSEDDHEQIGAAARMEIISGLRGIKNKHQAPGVILICEPMLPFLAMIYSCIGPGF